MTLQLAGRSERIPELYRVLEGRIMDTMPLLVSGKNEKSEVVDVPRTPASLAYILERRIEAPKDVREAWQDIYLFTGDGSTAGVQGDQLIVLGAQPLRELTPESDLEQGALVLSNGVWEELKSHKENILYLTADEVQEAQGQGYIKKDGVWVPANKTVGKVWDILSRGRDLTSYVQLVSESSPRSGSLLKAYFNQTIKDGKPTMRSWVADSAGYNSLALGNHPLSHDGGRLVGVAPEALAARAKIVAPLPLEAAVKDEVAKRNIKMIPEEHVRKLLTEYLGYTNVKVEQALDILNVYKKQ